MAEIRAAGGPARPGKTCYALAFRSLAPTAESVSFFNCSIHIRGADVHAGAAIRQFRRVSPERPAWPRRREVGRDGMGAGGPSVVLEPKSKKRPHPGGQQTSNEQNVPWPST